MKKSLSHLPKEKQAELMLIIEKIGHIVSQAELIFLFGFYARGDWVDGPHSQARGRLTIRKRRTNNFTFYISHFTFFSLAPCVEKLHDMTERICKEKIESFI